MRPRDLPAAFVKATGTYWPDRRQVTRAQAKQQAIASEHAAHDSARDQARRAAMTEEEEDRRT